MDTSIGFLLLVQVVLIALNAIFASAEIAVLSINETKLEKMAEDGNRKAKMLFKLTKQPARFLATIQVAITLSGFLGSAFAADNFSEPLVAWVISKGANLPEATLKTVAVVVITLILSYFTLVFGELVPKRLAMKKSEKISMSIAGLVSFISVVFKPIVGFLSISTNLILRILGVDPNEAEDEVSEEEIKMMVDAGTEKGTIDHQEKEFIQNVFEFNDTTAEDIAIHRTDVKVLLLEDSDEEWEEIIHQNRHSIYPVCSETTDNIVGVLNAKDYFRLKDKSRENVMENAVHTPYFVPSTIKADVLFRNMKTSHNHFSIVIDEYGGMVGIVTVYDLLEELVGDLVEDNGEDTEADTKIEIIDDTTFNITGNVELADLEEVTGLILETDEYSTFTGLVFNALDGIPDDGEQDITLELEEMTVHISLVEAHQVEKATVILKEKNSTEEE